MQTIVNAILAPTKIENYTFHNWDGHTSIEDLVENIRLYVSRITGWKLLLVEIGDDGVLTIEAKRDEASSVETLLKYSIPSKREIYGRVRHVGFTVKLLEELQDIYSNIRTKH